MLFTNIIYITGCLGFIGYHTTKKILDEGHKVIGVDKRTYASHDIFLDDLLTYKNFKFLQKDINELDSLYECDYVINIAAESHVDNSIINSNVFLMSNVNGVHHLLNLIYKFLVHLETLSELYLLILLHL